MPKIEESVEVEVPVTTAYDQWTQFEEFPSFMDGVERVTRIDDTHLHWVASIGGKDEEWDAEITEQKPDQRIAWRATAGKPNAGVVSFEKLDESRTKILLELEWESDGVVEALGSMLGADSRKVKGDLDRFKELIEKRDAESGALHSEVEASTNV